MSEKDILYLSDLKNGEEGIILKVRGHGAFRNRIVEMGFVKGKRVRVIKSAPLQDPVEYEIMDYNVSLRRSEAGMIEVLKIDGETNLYKQDSGQYKSIVDDDSIKQGSRESGNEISIAFVGNPNSGKTTIYNFASGSHERVGNYGGVTVDAKSAVFKRSGYTFRIVDLPGTYSITEYSPEELFVREHIIKECPDVVVNVVDASNLERNLYLTTQLIDMNIKVVMALNMYDELEDRGASLDYDTLGKMLGIPMVPTVAKKGRGINDLFDKIIEVYEGKDPVVRHIHIEYGRFIEEAIVDIQKLVRKNDTLSFEVSPRYLAVKFLEKDTNTVSSITGALNFEEINRVGNEWITAIEKEYKEPSGTVVSDARYGFIAGALGETYRQGDKGRRSRFDIDDILTHKYWGIPIFIFFMWLMFQVTFTLGNYPMEWIEAGVGWAGEQLTLLIPEGAVRDLVVDGIVAGVGGVIVFLPNILLLFLFISFMEDTGYMARAAFIMDKLMHKIGLHGKSFIPMLMGFGCNVPAIMATRTLESRKDRILTMMIIPFMSCSARFPVYVLFISAFFPNNQGLTLVAIYLIGVLIAVISAMVLKKSFFAKVDIPFVMELPPYRIPTAKSTLRHMWSKGAQYLKKMGTIILAASVIIWALGKYPTGTTMEESYIGKIGHTIEPAMAPLGFDWKAGVSIVTGLAAKEIVISTMGVLYQAEESDEENNANLQQKLKEQVHSTGVREGDRVFTPLVAFNFMLFILIYFPCIATIAAIRKEAGWRWALASAFYTTALAWIVCFVVFQIGNLIG
jgi:ferrous iron transporter FeoB